METCVGASNKVLELLDKGKTNNGRSLAGKASEDAKALKKATTEVDAFALKFDKVRPFCPTIWSRLFNHFESSIQ